MDLRGDEPFASQAFEDANGVAQETVSAAESLQAVMTRFRAA
jgi:hypothetical protein